MNSSSEITPRTLTGQLGRYLAVFLFAKKSFEMGDFVNSALEVQASAEDIKMGLDQNFGRYPLTQQAIGRVLAPTMTATLDRFTLDDQNEAVWDLLPEQRYRELGGAALCDALTAIATTTLAVTEYADHALTTILFGIRSAAPIMGELADRMVGHCLPNHRKVLYGLDE